MSKYSITTPPESATDGPAPTVGRMRDLASLARAIRSANKSVNKYAADFYRRSIDGGQAAIEAKALLPHGDFIPWIIETCEIGERQVQRWMSLARLGVTPQQILDNGGMKALMQAALKCDTVTRLGQSDRVKGEHDEPRELPAGETGPSFAAPRWAMLPEWSPEAKRIRLEDQPALGGFDSLAGWQLAAVEAVRARIGSDREIAGSRWMLSDRQYVLECQGEDWDAVYEAALARAAA